MIDVFKILDCIPKRGYILETKNGDCYVCKTIPPPLSRAVEHVVIYDYNYVGPFYGTHEDGEEFLVREININKALKIIGKGSSITVPRLYDIAHVLKEYIG